MDTAAAGRGKRRPHIAGVYRPSTTTCRPRRSTADVPGAGVLRPVRIWLLGQQLTIGEHINGALHWLVKPNRTTFHRRYAF